MLPVGQVTARGMPPGHVSPGIPAWIMLIVHMVNVIVVQQPIWIIHPVFRWGEMILGTVELIVGLTECSMKYAEPENQGEGNAGGHPKAMEPRIKLIQKPALG